MYSWLNIEVTKINKCSNITFYKTSKFDVFNALLLSNNHARSEFYVSLSDLTSARP